MFQYKFFRYNLFFNFSGTFFSALAPILATPLYVASFGISGYGLVGFVVLLQTILVLIEAGVSQTLTKEFISLRLDGDRIQASKFFTAFEAIYWALSLIIFLVIFFSSELIAGNWLNVDERVNSDPVSVIKVSALILATTLPGALYRAALLALESHFLVTGLNTFSIVLRHSVGVFVAMHYQSAFHLVTWFCIAAIFDVALKRYFSRKNYPRVQADLKNTFHRIKPIIKSSGALIIGTLIGSVAVHLDKIIVSMLLSVTEFGYFSIASSLSMGFLQLIYPISNASFPLVVANRFDRFALIKINFAILKLIMPLFILTSVVLFSFGENIFSLWLNDPTISEIIFDLFMLLFFGTFLNAVYSIGLNNMLAVGDASAIIRVNLLAFLTTALFLPFFITLFGLSGSPLGWIVFNAVALVVACVWYIRKYRYSLV